METAVSIQSFFTEAPFYERFALAKRAGFTLVEFGGWTELNLSRVTEELARNGLRLHAMTGADSFALADPAALEHFLEYLSQSVAVAKSFGCQNLIVQSSVDGHEPAAVSEASPAESADFTGRAAAANALIEASLQAERSGVTLFLKPAPPRDGVFTYLRTNSSAGSLVKVINSPALRLLYTFGGGHPIEDSVVSTFNRYKSSVGHVHVGDANLRVIKTALVDELGYDGSVGFTLGPGGDGGERLKEIAELFR